MSSPECWIAWTRLNTLEMLWMENGRRASPAWNSSPSRLYTAIPSWFGSTPASAGM